MREVACQKSVQPQPLVGCERGVIGNDRKLAEELFNGLCGDKLPQEEDMLIIHLTEIVNGQPVKLGSLGCSLEELCENCKSIIKNLFMQLNLAPPY